MPRSKDPSPTLAEAAFWFGLLGWLAVVPSFLVMLVYDPQEPGSPGEAAALVFALGLPLAPVAGAFALTALTRPLQAQSRDRRQFYLALGGLLLGLNCCCLFATVVVFG